MDFIAGVDGEGIPRVLACFMRALLAGEPLPLVEGGRQRRAFIYVERLHRRRCCGSSSGRALRRSR